MQPPIFGCTKRYDTHPICTNPPPLINDRSLNTLHFPHFEVVLWKITKPKAVDLILLVILCKLNMAPIVTLRFNVPAGAIIGDGDRKSWDARGPIIWDIFSIFRTNCAILTSYIHARVVVSRVDVVTLRGQILRIGRFSCGFFTAMAGNKEPGIFYVLLCS